MDNDTAPPVFGSRTYTISPAGMVLVEEVHQFKPATGEDEPGLLLRIARALGIPVQVEIRYQQGRISHAEARRIPCPDISCGKSTSPI